MNKLGVILTGRSLGRDVRKEILSQPGVVDIDFAGIEVASHSFCDEAFGKIAFEVDHPRNKIKFLNASDAVKTVIKQVVSDRLKEKQLSLV